MSDAPEMASLNLTDEQRIRAMHYYAKPEDAVDRVFQLERALAAANARAEKLEKAILKIRQALLPDPHDEREISIDWVRGAIGRIADAAIAAQEKPNE